VNVVQEKLRLFGYLLLAQKQYKDKSIAGGYNFGPDENDCITTGELVTMFCDNWGNGLSWENIYDNGPHEANFLKLDCSKAKTVLKWQPEINIKKAIDYTVEWSKNWIDGCNFIGRMDMQIKYMLDI